MVYLPTFTIQINHSCIGKYIPVPWILYGFGRCDRRFMQNTNRRRRQGVDISFSRVLVFPKNGKRQNAHDIVVILIYSIKFNVRGLYAMF